MTGPYYTRQIGLTLYTVNQDFIWIVPPLQGMEVGTGTHRDTPVILVKQSSRPLAENLVGTFKYGKTSSKPEPTYVDVYCFQLATKNEHLCLGSEISPLFLKRISLLLRSSILPKRENKCKFATCLLFQHNPITQAKQIPRRTAK